MILHVTCDISSYHMTWVRNNSRINVYSISIVAFRCYAFVIFCWINLLWKRIIRPLDDPIKNSSLPISWLKSTKSEIPSVEQTEIDDQNDLPFDQPVDTHVIVLYPTALTFWKSGNRYRSHDPNLTRFDPFIEFKKKWLTF